MKKKNEKHMLANCVHLNISYELTLMYMPIFSDEIRKYEK